MKVVKVFLFIILLSDRTPVKEALKRREVLAFPRSAKSPLLQLLFLISIRQSGLKCSVNLTYNILMMIPWITPLQLP